jgi:hypothetical protein
VVRRALVEWAASWRASGAPGGLSVRELAAVVPGMSGKSAADVRVVRLTVGNMVRAGELVCLGYLPRPPGASHGRTAGLYAPAPEMATSAESASLVLASVLTHWAPHQPDSVEPEPLEGAAGHLRA